MDAKELVETEMKEVTKPGRGFATFVSGVFSDGDVPSSSRVLSFILAMATVGILIGVFRHVCLIKDTTALGMWLANIPMIIAALVGLISAPYLINRGSASITDIFTAFKK